MDGQTFGLLLITLAFSGVPATYLLAMKNNRMSYKIFWGALLLGFVVLSVGTLYLLGRLK